MRVLGFSAEGLGFKGVSTGLYSGDIGTRFRGVPKLGVRVSFPDLVIVRFGFRRLGRGS